MHPFPITAWQKSFDPITQKKIKKKIKKLPDQGIIRLSTSSYNVGISLVIKKDGNIQVCIAPISLNKATIDDAHSLSNI